MTEQSISIERMEEAVNLFGLFDENIRIIEQELGVSVVNRESDLKISGEGENVMLAVKAIQGLLSLSARGEAISEQNVRYIIELVRTGNEGKIAPAGGGCGVRHCQGQAHQGQDHRPDAGMWRPSRTTPSPWAWAPPAPARPIWRWPRRWPPSGTSRSTASSSPARRWRRGSGWASCPATSQSKVDPYLRPLYDALFDMLGAETYQKYLERGNIEVAPLAYMRGRTLDDSFIILDEAQNTSREQMKMFLTRLGFGSKIVITGDVTQIDLPADKVSGLRGGHAGAQGTWRTSPSASSPERTWCATSSSSASSRPTRRTRSAGESSGSETSGEEGRA